MNPRKERGLGTFSPTRRAWRDGGRLRATGNSFAAPHISGIAALIRSKHPELRRFQVKTVLWATAANVREARGAPLLPGRLSRAIRPQTVSARATSPSASGRGCRA